MRKKLISLSIFMVLFFGGLLSIYAATATKPYGTAKYTRGVSRISWWMSYDDYGGWYEFQINNAINNWQSPGWSNPINFVEASSNVGTMMDFYAVDWWEKWLDEEAATTYGETFFYDSIGEPMGTPSNINYVFTRIYLNDYTMHNLPANEMKGTIAHEIGHSLGLQHNNTNLNSIMCQSNVYLNGTIQKRNVQTVQKTDNDAVVNLYS